MAMPMYHPEVGLLVESILEPHDVLTLLAVCRSILEVGKRIHDIVYTVWDDFTHANMSKKNSKKMNCISRLTTSYMILRRPFATGMTVRMHTILRCLMILYVFFLLFFMNFW